MNNVFVVDGNWYLHRVWFTLKTSRPIEQVLPQNFLALVLKDACAVKATHILVAFDGPKVFRYDVYPAYKANRDGPKGESSSDDEGGKDIYEYLPAVRDLLTDCGVMWTQQAKFEADDVWASAAAQYSSLPDTKVTGGCKDKDGYQCLTNKVRMYDSSAKPAPIFINKERAEKSKGVAVEHMVMYQTLIGDNIDNIPTLMGPAAARKVINKWGSFKAWFAGAERKEREWLRLNQVNLKRNKALVELRRDLSLPDLETLKVPKSRRLNMPKAWYAYQDHLYPKTKGLFRK